MDSTSTATSSRGLLGGNDKHGEGISKFELMENESISCLREWDYYTYILTTKHILLSIWFSVATVWA
jgi:hypothetical protein